jgi:toxin ParE1/3/4
MKYEVFISSEAETDLLAICSYIEEKDSRESADRIFIGLTKTSLGLEEFPECGHCPPELERIHVREYSEIHFKPFRIIYRISGYNVFIHAILDGRKNLQDTLFDRITR